MKYLLLILLFISCNSQNSIEVAKRQLKEESDCKNLSKYLGHDTVSWLRRYDDGYVVCFFTVEKADEDGDHVRYLYMDGVQLLKDVLPILLENGKINEDDNLTNFI